MNIDKFKPKTKLNGFKIWIKRITDKRNFKNIESLFLFYNEVYLNLDKEKKQAVSVYLKNHDFNITNLNEMLVYHSNFKSKNAIKGSVKFSNKLSKNELKEYHNKRLKKVKEKRIEKSGSLKKSYRNGIINKGKKIAEKLGLTNLNEEDLIHLSGYSKKKNYRNLTEKERNDYVLNWKKSNLLNSNIRKKILKEYPDFLLADLNSNEEIEKWYSTYISIKNMFDLKYRSNSRFHNGFFTSLKNKKNIYYRSSYELTCLKYLERINEVIEFDTEPFHLKYKRNNENFERKYVPDVIIILDDGRKKLLEVKPEIYVEDFKIKKLQYLNEKIYIINEKYLNDYELFRNYITN